MNRTNEYQNLADETNGFDLFDGLNASTGGGGDIAPQPLPSRGHNRRVQVRDLLNLAPQHERRHIDEADLKEAMPRAAEPWNWHSFPVTETAVGLFLVDGAVLIAAIHALDPETMVEYTVVSEEEALKIRSRNCAPQSKREPMARARRVLILSAADLTLAEIARELRISGDDELTEARISQLRRAAEAEARYPDLASIMTDPARIPVGFCEAIAGQLKDLAAADKAKPMDGVSRVEQFDRKVEALIRDISASADTIPHSECAKRLGLNRTDQSRPRARHIGEKHLVPGTDAHVGFALKRAGGAAISLPHSLTKDEAALVFRKVMAEVASVIANRANGSAN